MVLINEKKYACEKCIKGHRVSGCTHTDRPLYEIKKKGRPATQCSHCKEKRKSSGSSVHTKCACGDTKNPQTAPSVIPPPSIQTNSTEPSTAPQESEHESDIEIETRKGQPGSRATFPRGFKDVLELASAANALAGLVGEDTGFKVAERSVNALLNPCKCQSGGPCKCCHPKKNDNSPGNISESSSSAGRCCGSSSTTGSAIPRRSPPLPANPHLSPENMHHPAHTSPHVHKTKLFSPYSANPASQSRHVRRDTVSSSRSSGRSTPLPKALRPPPPTIKPLTDFGRLIGAAINQDGTINSEIPRSAVGLPNLPGISTFDTAAKNGGAKVEPMEYEDVDVDMPLAFPTNEDVVIGACMCGEECPCPGCATHDNSAGSNDQDHHHHHRHEAGAPCGEGCKGRHDCNHSIAVPSGVTSIAQLISLAASHVPPPPQIQRYTNASLDPHDTRILPPAAQVNQDVARTMGIVQLKPLECCNGRCQCLPGQCVCEKECCGCCVRCACSEDDEDARMGGTENNHGQPPIENVQAKSSCCSSKNNNPPNLVEPQPSPLDPSAFLASTSSSQIQPSPTLLSPDHAFPSSRSGSRQPSPTNSGSTTPVNLSSAPSNNGAIRRATSISSRSIHQPESQDTNSSSHRRATVTGNPPAIAIGGPSKTTNKAVAPYNAQHHRTILPKPSSSTHLSVNTSVNNANDTRQPSPSRRKRSSASAGPTRSGSPSTGERERTSSISNATTSATTSTSQATTNNQQAHYTPLSAQAQSQVMQPFPIQSVLPHQQSIDDNYSYQWTPQIQQVISHDPNTSIHYQPSANDIAQHVSAPDMSTTYSGTQTFLPENSDIDPSNAALLAFLQQFTQPNPQSSQAQLQPQAQAQPQYQPHPQSQPQPQVQLQSAPSQFDENWFNQMQQPGLSHNVSGNTSPELDQPFDLDQFITQALGNQSVQESHFEPQLQSHSQVNNQSQPQQQPQQQHQQPQMQMSNPSIPDFADFFLNSAPPSIITNPASQSQQPTTDYNPVNPLDANLNSFYGSQSSHGDASGSNEKDLQFVTLVPGLPAEASFSPNWTSAGAKDQITQDRRKQLRDISANKNQPPQPLHPPSPSQYDNSVPNSHQQRTQSHHVEKQLGASASTDDMIDLSKPLSADTLNKIMKALQNHSNHLTSSSSTSTPTASNNNRDQDVSTPVAYNDTTTTPKPINDLPQPQSQIYLPQLNPSTSDGVDRPSNRGGNGSSGPPEVTKDLDDMFNQFVTLDGIGLGNPNGLPHSQSIGSDSNSQQADWLNLSNNSNSNLGNDGLNLNMNMNILGGSWGKNDIWTTSDGYL